MILLGDVTVGGAIFSAYLYVFIVRLGSRLYMRGALGDRACAEKEEQEGNHPNTFHEGSTRAGALSHMPDAECLGSHVWVSSFPIKRL